MVAFCSQFDIVLVSLDPTVGSEIKKTRPAIVVSPNSINKYLKTVIIAPMSSKSRTAPFRVKIAHDGTEGLILLDQLRTIDRQRIVKSLGHADYQTATNIKLILQEMFE